MPRGGSSKVQLENVQSGFSMTFSTRRVVSAGAGCLGRSRIFVPADFQNLTRQGPEQTTLALKFVLF